jgi:hypothetical protein
VPDEVAVTWASACPEPWYFLVNPMKKNWAAGSLNEIDNRISDPRNLPG